MKDERIVIAADCAVLVNKNLAERFGSETVIIGCPMLEDPKRIFEKLKMIAEESEAKEFEVYTMEVPCCIALHMMIEKAKKGQEVKSYIVRVGGEVEDYKGFIDERMVEAERRAHRGY